ncbi:hypothetical protein C5B96_12180 [Subtercola sp. Z020]|uniref:DUF2510 domain-containing protein n=1 Tax=Subtercola sp. Z020 TaxID=2080582 RepID=UPI000CE84188|nr:DUF2510 domain-containing protein [Subtercola sp. Z020]PPF79791.1 hypothetical protein C5B96_12180 [Subtercola sp. Z020]
MSAPPPGWYPDPTVPGNTRWWDGTRWTHHMPVPPAQRATPAAPNGFATAALVLGICGFVLMGIPFGIGLLLGGIPDVLAVVFGIVALTRAPLLGGVGRAPAIVGIVLGGVSLLSVGIGAGWLW